MPLYPSGFRIAGRYEVAGRPLMGGMGIVYLCFDHQEHQACRARGDGGRFPPRQRTWRAGRSGARSGAATRIRSRLRVL